MRRISRSPHFTFVLKSRDRTNTQYMYNNPDFSIRHRYTCRVSLLTIGYEKEGKRREEERRKKKKERKKIVCVGWLRDSLCSTIELSSGIKTLLNWQEGE